MGFYDGTAGTVPTSAKLVVLALAGSRKIDIKPVINLRFSALVFALVHLTKLLLSHQYRCRHSISALRCLSTLGKDTLSRQTLPRSVGGSSSPLS
jgi:hypothetical protein